MAALPSGVNGHLVTIEVGVERRTSMGAGASSISFGWKCPDTKPGEGLGPCSEEPDVLSVRFQNIPKQLLLLSTIFGRFYSLNNTALNHFADDEWFESSAAISFGNPTS